MIVANKMIFERFQYVYDMRECNQTFGDTLPLRVAGNGTAHSSQYFANSFKICFADRNLLTLESSSHGLYSKCTDLIDKRCTCLLRTGGSPMSFMSFVNFSQFNLHFVSFAIEFTLHMMLIIIDI